MLPMMECTVTSHWSERSLRTSQARRSAKNQWTVSVRAASWLNLTISMSGKVLSVICREVYIKKVFVSWEKQRTESSSFGNGIECHNYMYILFVMNCFKCMWRLKDLILQLLMLKCWQDYVHTGKEQNSDMLRYVLKKDIYSFPVKCEDVTCI